MMNRIFRHLPLPNRTLARAVAALTLLSATSGCDVLSPDPTATIGKDTVATPVTGQQLYIDHCAACHGLTGVALDSIDIPSLKHWQGTAGKFDSTLNEGPAGMPTFPNLNADQRQKIFEYVKTL